MLIQKLKYHFDILISTMPIILNPTQAYTFFSKNLKHRDYQHITKSPYTTIIFTNENTNTYHHTQIRTYIHFIHILSFIRVTFRDHFQKKNHFI